MVAFDERHLEHAGFQLAVCPALGGAITRFAFDGFDLLRRWDGSDQVRQTSCFVLAPYSNRVAGSHFAFAGTPYALRRNSPDHALPIHGVGWKRAWQVDEQGPNQLTLSLEHDPGQGDASLDWPFAFRLIHSLRLSDRGLDMTLELINTDARAMPAGLGWHPFFPRHGQIELAFAAKAVWLADAEQLPAEQVAIPPQWDFQQMRPVETPGLDNNFTGWDGRARIAWPDRLLELTIETGPGLEYLIVYTPPGKDFIAVEPVSHANAALNRGGDGLESLEPGQTLTRHCRLQLSRLQAD